MDLENKEIQKIDLFALLGHFLKEAKRRIALLLVLVVLCGSVFSAYSYMNYRPSYTAYASFTVKVANPLYAGVSTYNSKTAEQMATTFPYILTSGVLQERVKGHLGVSYLPSISVSANSSSSIITMYVTDGNAQNAYDVLNAVMTYYPEIAEFVVGSTVLVKLDESGVPQVPDNSFSFKSSAIKGVLIGAAIWFVIVFIFAITKNTVYNEEKLKRIISAPCIGLIPQVKLNKRNRCPLIYKNKTHTGFSEAIRLLRLRAEKILAESNKKVLLISSAIPGEGKTTISVNLAAAIAKKDRKVLIIDCDLRNPSIAKTISVGGNYSLPEFIRGEASFREVIAETEVTNLFAVSGGEGGDVNIDTTSLSKISELVNMAKKEFDVVILDTPPCSLLADASEFSDLA